MCGSGLLGVFQDLSNAQSVAAVGKGNAKTINAVAVLEADKIKRDAQRLKSSAMAAAAENGLDVNIGSPTKIADEIIGDAAYNASLTRSQAGYQAGVVRRAANQQRNNYGMQAYAGVMKMAEDAMTQGATGGAGGWK